MFELKDKIALVTGAGSGIGESIALTFAQAGAHVIVTDRDIEGGQATTQAILEQQQKAKFVRLDVTDEDEAVQLAQRVVDQHGHLDILVNNAGIGQVGTIEQTRGEDMDRLYAVNVLGGALGAALGGLLLLEWLGVFGTYAVGLGTGVLAATGAWLLSRGRIEGRVEESIPDRDVCIVTH